MQLSPDDIQSIVRKVIDKINRGEQVPQRAAESYSPPPVAAPAAYSPPATSVGVPGVFADMDTAVREATRAQQALMGMTLEKRRAIIANMRKRFREAIPGISDRTVAE
ncbi:MAG: hypothetical protein FD129_1138, partial [bacterium]